MRRETLYGAVLFLVFTLALPVTPSSAVDTLSPNDFRLESFSKTVDFFNFARQYAASQGKPVPPDDWHAYLYLTYINVSGFQLYFSGLINITAGQGALTIPVQSFLEHYKTPAGKDVLMSSSFIMLLAFNDTVNSRYSNSPDVNDNLYASFSLGLDLSIYGNSSKPALSSKTTVLPLTSSDDKLTWDWGMRYTNLTAVWWRIFIDPLHPLFRTALPIAITTYEELTFTYRLTLNPSAHTAKVTANYVIGRMTNLWLFQWLPPVVTHYNSTGTYRLNGTKISNENIYQYLERQHIKMSIVLFQNSLVLNHATKSTSLSNGQNVTDAEVDVSSGAIVTEAANERIFEANFGTKQQYKLFNYTADPTEATSNPYDAVTRTAPRAGYAKNPLFSMHVALLKYVPMIVKHIDPPLYQRAKDHMLNMTYADYFYLISYPKYGGFKIVHDPTYTAYITTTSPTIELPRLFGFILIGGIIAAAVIGAMYFTRRRGQKIQSVQPPTPPAT